MFEVFLTAAVIIFIVLIIRGSGEQNPFDIKGKEIWRDEGKHTKAFVNHHYQIVGKPDHIFESHSGEIIAVEFKSRKGRVYESDIVQTLASCLALRSEMDVQRALVCTQTTKVELNLGSDQDLWERIQGYAFQVKTATQGQVIQEYRPSIAKCQSCSVRAHCWRKS
ncbi:CRISPR-associated protein Cas4 [Motilimonas pumila]|uniref:Dna2/Cas4 domain-containing protein n=1 Tax=Motilimonas pumila TaxID=2303987 RepID=A0A418YA25_9GAMM|nr:PD-(D/E)XK nuclease family protein [Motilimonas pumila]RJG38770.1 Dna2/Cas4 domain-containing protein [Motilimonas pumila]